MRSDYLTHQSAELALDVAFAKAGDIYRGVKRIFSNKTIQSTSAAGILDEGSGLKIHQAVNSNNPLTTAANRNRIPLSFESADTSEGLRLLANRMNGTHGGAHFSNGLTINSTKMSTGESGRTSTQAALGKISGEPSVSCARPSGLSTMNVGVGSSSAGSSRPNLTVVGENAGLQIPTKPSSTLLTREQPWTIHHEDQLWKTKIIGEAQWTGTRAEQTMRTNAHAEQCYRAAIELAQDPNVEKVFLNRGIKKASGHPIQGSNRRPDVTYVTKDGKVHAIEVESFTDQGKDLVGRVRQVIKELPMEMRGNVKKIDYNSYKDKGKK